MQRCEARILENEDIRQSHSLDKSLTKYTPDTIASVDALIRKIEQIRIRKVAIDEEEALAVGGSPLLAGILSAAEPAY